MKSKLIKIAAIAVAACALIVMLAGCGKSSYEQVTLDDANGVKVTAENAGSDQTATTEGVITVKEGDIIVISPALDSGSFHVTIATADGSVVAYDDMADGRIMFPIDAEPGVYDVTTSANGGTTGWMTIFAKNKAEYDAENAALDAAAQEAAAQQEAAQ